MIFYIVWFKDDTTDHDNCDDDDNTIASMEPASKETASTKEHRLKRFAIVDPTVLPEKSKALLRENDMCLIDPMCCWKTLWPFCVTTMRLNNLNDWVWLFCITKTLPLLTHQVAGIECVRSVWQQCIFNWPTMLVKCSKVVPWGNNASSIDPLCNQNIARPF